MITYIFTKTIVFSMLCYTSQNSRSVNVKSFHLQLFRKYLCNRNYNFYNMSMKTFQLKKIQNSSSRSVQEVKKSSCVLEKYIAIHFICLSTV